MKSFLLPKVCGLVAMTVAIEVDDSESLRDQVETAYRQDDPEVPDESKADNVTSSMPNGPCC